MGSARLLGSDLDFMRAFSVYAFVTHGPELPVDINHCHKDRLNLLYSCAPYCLSNERLQELAECESGEADAKKALQVLLHGIIRNAEQRLKYHF